MFNDSVCCTLVYFVHYNSLESNHVSTPYSMNEAHVLNLGLCNQHGFHSGLADSWSPRLFFRWCNMMHRYFKVWFLAVWLRAAYHRDLEISHCTCVDISVAISVASLCRFVDFLGFPKAGLASLRRSDPMDADTTFSARQPQPRRSSVGWAHRWNWWKGCKSCFEFLQLSHYSHIV